ncbi:MAG TPA: DUF1648 domain-containing protein [Thermoanaerobaculia bacterium]|nr:DUF1648 domain-containing protein [Thermoanaerobaculia bacterium]
MNARPVLSIPRSAGEVLLEVAAAAGLALMIGGLAAFWGSIPERVPVHFGVTGTPDRWGSKGEMLILLAVTLALYTGLTFISRIPHHFNYPWQITEANARELYRLSRLLLTGLKAIVVWMFTSLLWGSVEVALGRSDGLDVFLPVFLLLIFGWMGLQLARMYRAQA